jgi:hypothetical protein
MEYLASCTQHEEKKRKMSFTKGEKHAKKAPVQKAPKGSSNKQKLGVSVRSDHGPCISSSQLNTSAGKRPRSDDNIVENYGSQSSSSRRSIFADNPLAIELFDNLHAA